MSLIDKIKEKIAKEKPVETTSDSENKIYTNKPYNFKVKILEQDIIDYLSFIVSKHNEKNPNDEINPSDVLNAILLKGLYENIVFYQYTKTYKDLIDDSSSIRVAMYKLHYFENKTYPLSKANEKLKADVKNINNDKELLLKENEELKSELDSIKKIVNKE